MSCVVHLQDPVCTPDGFLFSKEAIIENLVQQKKAIKRKLAAWEAQQSDDQLKVSASAARNIADFVGPCLTSSHQELHLKVLSGSQIVYIALSTTTLLL